MTSELIANIKNAEAALIDHIREMARQIQHHPKVAVSEEIVDDEKVFIWKLDKEISVDGVCVWYHQIIGFDPIDANPVYRDGGDSTYKSLTLDIVPVESLVKLAQVVEYQLKRLQVSKQDMLNFLSAVSQYVDSFQPELSAIINIIQKQ